MSGIGRYKTNWQTFKMIPEHIIDKMALSTQQSQDFLKKFMDSLNRKPGRPKPLTKEAEYLTSRQEAILQSMAERAEAHVNQAIDEYIAKNTNWKTK